MLQDQNEIGKLRDELARLEDAKIKSRSAPEAENRRKTTQHANSMKKLRNELNGFMKLNQITWVLKTQFAAEDVMTVLSETLAEKILLLSVGQWAWKG